MGHCKSVSGFCTGRKEVLRRLPPTVYLQNATYSLTSFCAYQDVVTLLAVFVENRYRACFTGFPLFLTTVGYKLQNLFLIYKCSKKFSSHKR